MKRPPVPRPSTLAAFAAALALACGPSRPSTSAPPPPPRAPEGAAAAPASQAPPADAEAIVAAPDRLDADRALDAGRKPAKLLALLALPPGARVAELMAGGGYTAELLARAVGPTGRVYAQNNAFVLEKFAKAPLEQRLLRPGLGNVVRVDRELDAPLPPEAKDLDLVVLNLFYHDAVWMKVDRAAMNRAIFQALAPGGRYVVADHAARAGSGVADVQTLHRIDEAIVVDEVKQAGFALSTSADFLREPSDTRDWNASPSAAGERRGSSDRFVLVFTKPAR